MKQAEVDFRVQFGRMPGNAVISRTELAQLLCTTPGSISQLVYRGMLPKKAFPNVRRACWFVSDIREWLDREAECLVGPAKFSLLDARCRSGILSERDG
jgi:predicted DNA-binding transcriptional regulator AlpA